MDQMELASIAKSVIVYGLQACGKTRHAEAIAAHFGVAGWSMNGPRVIRLNRARCI